MLAMLAALLALAAGACNRGAVPTGSAHDTGASQARSVPPPPSGAAGVPGTPGEPPTNELMPRSQSVRIGNAPPPPPPGVGHGESKE
ncbi:MAG TPA: hypothetical protein VJA16_06875, partial [Thermoanaerobaculia bacterium]